MLTDLHGLCRYMAWSNRIFYQAVAGLPEGEVERQRPMLFGSILNLLHHVYAMDVVWQQHMIAGSHDYQQRNPPACSFAELSHLQAELDDWFVEYVTHLSRAQSCEVIEFEFIGGGTGNMTRAAMIQHVVNHTSYHRGHIEGVFYQLGIEPPTTDIPVFLRDNCSGFGARLT